jgi:hypothetical protein
MKPAGLKTTENSEEPFSSSGIQNDIVVLPKSGRVGILVATDASHYLHLGVGVVGGWVPPISVAGCSNP